MLRFFCKSLVTIKDNDFMNCHVLFLRTISSTVSASQTSGTIDQKNFTISYLVSSCGLPPKSAASTAQKICIETTKGPDSVIELFRTYGFTDTQIATVIRTYPRLLFSNPVKTLKPKLEFFQSVGFSRPDLARFICLQPNVLWASLQKRIIPALNFLRTFIHADKNLIAAPKRNGQSIKRYLEPNVATLRSFDVFNSSISSIIISQPKVLMLSVSKLKDAAEVVTDMGFDPNRSTFFIAIYIISVLRKMKWERKREVFRSFGFSDDEILSAFKLQPMVMLSSEEKLMNIMNFFLNNMRLKPSVVARYPNTFLLSLEKRIIPRCTVLQILMSRGLEKDVNVLAAVLTATKNFDKRFVTRYKEEVPEVIKAYKGEMGILGFDS